MFTYLRRHAENIIIISVLTLSWAGVVAAGLYGNGTWA